jgi:hypothetical protein
MSSITLRVKIPYNSDSDSDSVSIPSTPPLTPLTPSELFKILSPKFKTSELSPNKSPLTQTREVVEKAIKTVNSSDFVERCKSVVERGSDNCKPEHFDEWEEVIELCDSVSKTYLTRLDMHDEDYEIIQDLRLKLLFCIKP